MPISALRRVVCGLVHELLPVHDGKRGGAERRHSYGNLTFAEGSNECGQTSVACGAGRRPVLHSKTASWLDWVGEGQQNVVLYHEV